MFITSLSRRLVRSGVNPLNTKLNHICHLLALLAHHILHVSRIRVNTLAMESIQLQYMCFGFCNLIQIFVALISGGT
jgi:hypothetical protein